ncbi:glycerol dehydrogenase [Methanomethylophilus alvi]|uniref:Glycerol dehydrogenase n=1 Tax=Methanomethylophilus alvi TaxID=1291540 RepID=A0A3G3IFM0_9ARCH|nr:glycerol dehydrogenase [Methanomethylophilus alvi]
MNTASYEIKAEAEKMPSYQLSRLGAMINRVLIAGVLTEKENVGSPEEPLWRGRIQDVASGTVYINIGRYQPEAAAAMVDIEPPCLVAVVGKVKSYTTEDQRTYVSVRPERIIPIDENTQREWLLDTARSTWKRLVDMKTAMGTIDKSVAGLTKEGFSELSAKGISLALEQYGMPDSAMFLKSIQAALRTLLPDKNVDLGLPEDLSENPEEIDLEPQSSGDDSEDKEEIVLELLTELDTEGKGAPRDDLERRAEQEGISSMELEEITNTLMDKGVIYEPNLRYLKRI